MCMRCNGIVVRAQIVSQFLFTSHLPARTHLLIKLVAKKKKKEEGLENRTEYWLRLQ